MFEKIENCPLCNSGHFSNYLICKDHSVSQEEFAIVQCADCQLLFTNPRPTAEFLGQYYESDQYISHQDKGNSLINFIYRIARTYTLKKKVKLINGQVSQPGSLLDFGCGTGHFLAAASKAHWAVTGVEPNNLARQQAEAKQLNVFSDLADIEGQHQYDLITLWHVLEHVPNLNDTIINLSDLLSKNGTLIVAVPNHKSYDAQKYKNNWAGYDVPRHLYHFDHTTMKKLMKKHKLKVKEILPMKLDSYYVSLLSSKYQNNGNQKVIDSILTGYKSNVYARNNSINYSSNIYIIRK